MLYFMKKMFLFLLIFFSFLSVNATDSKLFDLWWSLWELSNTNIYSTFSDNFVLTWSIYYHDNFGYNIDKVEVIWSWDKKPYILKKFKSWDKEFKYNVSVKNKNLNEWWNIYTINLYKDWKKVYTYKYEVNYINKYKKSTYILKKLDEKIVKEKSEHLQNSNYYSENRFDKVKTEGWWFWNDFYTFNKEKWYLLWVDNSKFWKHILNLSNWYSMIYTVSYKDWKDFSDSFDYKVKIWYTDKNWKTKYSEEKDIYLWFWLFKYDYLKIYDNWKILITAWWWHEWVASYYYFNPKDFRLYNVEKDIIKKNLWENYETVYDLNIIDNKLVINESKYCCDIYYNQGWFEKVAFDWDNLKLISRNLISPLKKWEWWNEFENITLFKEKYFLPINTHSKLEFKKESDKRTGIIQNWSKNGLYFADNLSINPENYGFSLNYIAILGVVWNNIGNSDKIYKVVNPEFIDSYYKNKKSSEINMNFKEVTWKVYKNEYIEIEKFVQ